MRPEGETSDTHSAFERDSSLWDVLVPVRGNRGRLPPDHSEACNVMSSSVLPRFWHQAAFSTGGSFGHYTPSLGAETLLFVRRGSLDAWSAQRHARPCPLLSLL
jgi:hypothetical protein